MEKKTMAFSTILGMLVISGMAAYAYEYNKHTTIDDKMLTDCNTAATAKGETTCVDQIDKKVNGAINEVLYGDRIVAATMQLQKELSKLSDIEDPAVYEAVNECIARALEAKP